MKTKKFQTLLLVLGFASAIFAGILSNKVGSIQIRGGYQTSLDDSGNGTGAGASIDIAADGGAAGFAILAGLCFIAVAITTLKNENK